MLTLTWMLLIQSEVQNESTSGDAEQIDESNGNNEIVNNEGQNESSDLEEGLSSDCDDSQDWDDDE